MVLESRPGHYPVIVLPYDLQAALEAVPPVPQVPVRPGVPRAPDKVSTFNFGIVVLGGGLLMSAVSEVGILGMAFGVILIIIQHFSIQTTKRTHARELHAYTVALQAVEEYPAKMMRYHQEVVHHQAPGYAERYRREQINKELAATTKPAPMSAMQQLTIQKGSSEANFNQVLMKRFGPSYISSALCLPITYGRRDNNYYPDFTYSHPSGLRIDIEIDEPYSGVTKEPIHYRGQDAQRNKYFTEKGWVVLRFAEQQIVTQPELCCQLVEQVALELTASQDYLFQMLGTLMPVPQWTMEQAREMARRNIRESYTTSSIF